MAHDGSRALQPAFWDGGLRIIETQLEAATTAACEAGRLSR